ncbi:MAG: thioredoxin domain-containing protein, partial [Saprospiraceae bacterium]
FARYSTDAEWLAPHFEKMLYDNGLLVSLLADFYAKTREEKYKETIVETLDWVKREMLDENGGFYSALDADSEGEEGTFYVWNKSEVDRILGDDAIIFNTYFDVSEEGNWEGKNILRKRISLEKLAMKSGMETLELQKLMSRWKKLLFWERENRIRPSLDDKILLDWNALMCKAFIQAYKATGNEEYKEIAQKNIDFIYKEMKNEGGFFHSFRNGKAKQPAFLDDYAFFIDNLLCFYEVTFEICYLNEAKRLANFVIERFYDANEHCFYFVEAGSTDILIRKKEFYDNATPSGNAVMMSNLLKLSILLNHEDFQKIGKQGLEKMAAAIEKYPLSFGRWVHAAQMLAYPVKEVAIVGKEAFSISKEINKAFIPNKIITATLEEDDRLPLLQGRYKEDETLIYLCTNYECKTPSKTLVSFFAQIES